MRLASSGQLTRLIGLRQSRHLDERDPERKFTHMYEVQVTYDVVHFVCLLVRGQNSISR